MRTRLAAMLPFLLVAASGTTGFADDPSPASRYKEVLEQMQAAQNKYVSELYWAKNPKQAREAFALEPSTSEYAEKFVDIARKGSASDGGLDAILWVISNSPDSAAADECYRILVRDYLDNRQIINIIRSIASWPTAEGEKFIRAALEKSTLESVRADACNTLGALVVARARREAGTDAGKASHDQATALYKKLGSEYGSVSSGGTSYGDLAKVALAKLGPPSRDGKGPRLEEGVNVGKKAPEIAATNTRGEATRLSGYEGSVVVLAFWGNWCPWCHDIYPFGRDRKYRPGGGKPFVLLGVNSDGSPEQLQQVMAAEGITWPNWWDGRGPIAARYQIGRWPTTFILDHRGVIRYKMEGTVDEESLNRAVATLQEEQARDPNPTAKVQVEKTTPQTPKKMTKKKTR